MTFVKLGEPMRFFKRYRMDRDLPTPLPPVPALPADFAWIAWEDRLLPVHAEVKYECFHQEMDGIVFPNLSSREGCMRLMKEIRHRNGFRPEATWLLAHGGRYVGTVQGVSDRAGVGGIQNLGIVADARGHGLGTALLLQALHGFRRAGLQRATLEVTADNAGAIRLYRRFGFTYRKIIYKISEPPLPLLPLAEVPDWAL